MKIRHPVSIAIFGFLAAWCIRLWMFTVRYRHRANGPDLTPHRPDLAERFIYAMWHEDMLISAFQYARPDVHVLISQHADGQIIANAVKHLGLKVVNGSSTRGGAAAILKLMGVAKVSHIVITPDGPRGPRQTVQSGIVHIAAKTGLPIVVIGFGYASAWRAKSWDRMAMPKPFSRVVGITQPPIRVPHSEDKEVLEGYRVQVEEAMRDAALLAQAEVTSGKGHADQHRQAA